jgi:hypothetical protein
VTVATAGAREVACTWLVYVLLILEANLYGLIAIAGGGTNLGNDARPNLNQGDAVRAAIFPVEGGHPYFSSQ